MTLLVFKGFYSGAVLGLAETAFLAVPGLPETAFLPVPKLPYPAHLAVLGLTDTAYR